MPTVAVTCTGLASKQLLQCVCARRNRKHHSTSTRQHASALGTTVRVDSRHPGAAAACSSTCCDSPCTSDKRYRASAIVRQPTSAMLAPVSTCRIVGPDVKHRDTEMMTSLRQNKRCDCTPVINGICTAGFAVAQHDHASAAAPWFDRSLATLRTCFASSAAHPASPLHARHMHQNVALTRSSSMTTPETGWPMQSYAAYS